MSLANALIEEGSARKGPTCSMVAILASLDDNDRAALLAAFASTQPSSSISRALATVNVQVGGSTVSRHRRGECTCG